MLCRRGDECGIHALSSAGNTGPEELCRCNIIYLQLGHWPQHVRAFTLLTVGWLSVYKIKRLLVTAIRSLHRDKFVCPPLPLDGGWFFVLSLPKMVALRDSRGGFAYLGEAA